MILAALILTGPILAELVLTALILAGLILNGLLLTGLLRTGFILKRTDIRTPPGTQDRDGHSPLGLIFRTRTDTREWD